MKPVIFLDRDGVINQDRTDYVKSWAEFIFLPDVLESFKILKDNDFRVIVISNQSCIGKGIISEDRVRSIHDRMIEAVKNAGGEIHGIYFCPHTPEDNCPCRKPRPGLLLQAAADHHIDLKSAYFAGDNRRDIEAGFLAGCQTVFLRTGVDADNNIDDFPVKPDLVFDCLGDFVRRLAGLADTQLRDQHPCKD